MKYHKFIDRCTLAPPSIHLLLIASLSNTRMLHPSSPILDPMATSNLSPLKNDESLMTKRRWWDNCRFSMHKLMPLTYAKSDNWLGPYSEPMIRIVFFPQMNRYIYMYIREFLVTHVSLQFIRDGIRFYINILAPSSLHPSARWFSCSLFYDILTSPPFYLHPYHLILAVWKIANLSTHNKNSFLKVLK